MRGRRLYGRWLGWSISGPKAWCEKAKNLRGFALQYAEAIYDFLHILGI